MKQEDLDIISLIFILIFFIVLYFYPFFLNDTQDCDPSGDQCKTFKERNVSLNFIINVIKEKFLEYKNESHEID